MSYHLAMEPAAERTSVILDTNVLVSGFTSGAGASRRVLRYVLEGQVVALVSHALFLEYEDVLSREDTRARCPLTVDEQERLFDAFLACTRQVEVYYLWRPNLRDEGDNHVLELAVAANAPLLTHNVRDFRDAQLHFPGVRVLTPGDWLKEVLPCPR